MRKIFILFLLLLIPLFSLAQEDSEGVNTPPALCLETLSINGSEKMREGTSQEYTILSENPIFVPKSVTYSLTQEEKNIDTLSRDKYIFNPDDSGAYVLTANVSYGIDCQKILIKKIRVYPFTVTYIGDTTSDDGEVDMITDTLSENNILFQQQIITKSSVSPIADFDDFMNKNIKKIQESDVLVVNTGEVLGFFDSLVKIGKNNTATNFASKHIFIVSNINPSFLAKILGRSIGSLGISEVSLIQPSGLLEVLLKVGPDTLEFGTQVSYSTESTSYSLSRFLELLLYYGFGYTFLGFLLKITVALLAINFLKQVVGVHIFGIYNPMFLALSFAVFGINLTAIFLLVAFLTTRIINLISRFKPFLYNARRALLITLYILLSLIFLGLNSIYGWNLVEYSIFTNIFTIFPFLFLIMAGDKFFHEDINIWSRAGMVSFAQFLIISLVVYFIISSTVLQQFLISYPDMLYLIFLLNFLIGRYTGLQFFEYIRFAPLIKKLQEEE